MPLSRRESGRLGLSAIPATAIAVRGTAAAAQAAHRPNSLISGVNLRTITLPGVL